MCDPTLDAWCHLRVTHSNTESCTVVLLLPTLYTGWIAKAFAVPPSSYYVRIMRASHNRRVCASTKAGISEFTTLPSLMTHSPRWVAKPTQDTSMTSLDMYCRGDYVVAIATTAYVHTLIALVHICIWWQRLNANHLFAIVTSSDRGVALSGHVYDHNIKHTYESTCICLVSHTTSRTITYLPSDTDFMHQCTDIQYVLALGLQHCRTRVRRAWGGRSSTFIE